MKVYNPFVGWVEFKDTPEKIVSLDPSITETIYLLGADEKLVGVSSWCHKPKDALKKTKVGSYTHLLEDKVLELDPDLVFTTTGAQRGVLERLLQLSIPTYPISYPKDLYSILSMISDVGGLIGKTNEALNLCALMLESVNELKGFARKDLRPRVYVEIDLGGPTIPAYFNHISHALHLAGLKNVFDDKRVDYLYGMEVKGYDVLNIVEELKNRDPDIILFESKSLTPSDDEGLEVMLSRGLTGLRAVKEERVLTLPADTLAHYGPSFFREARSVIEKVWRLLK